MKANRRRGNADVMARRDIHGDGSERAARPSHHRHVADAPVGVGWAAQAPSDDTMQAPIGVSGVHGAEELYGRGGVLTPRRIARIRGILWSGTGW